MDCEQCFNDLTAYLDGELAPSRSRMVAAHVENCRRCNEVLNELRTSSEFVAAHVNDLEPEPRIWNNLRTRIVGVPIPSAQGGLIGSWFKHRWLAAAAIVVLAFGIWFYVDHLNYQREVQQYMSNYISTRELQDQTVRGGAAESPLETTGVVPSRAMGLNNPFVVARSVSFENPFKSEGQ